MTPCYFGRSDSPLLGVHHPPKGRARARGVLLCYPGREEAMRVHWAYRNLTAQLVKAGFHVFRFDYFGTGDSAGESDEGDVVRWREDVRAAATELRDIAGVQSVALVGARLGAALALTLPAPPERVAVADVIAWDPVVDGAAYVAELKALQQLRFRKSRYRLERLLDPKAPELLGYPFGPALEASIGTLDLLGAPLVAPPRATIVASEPRPEHARLAARLACEIVTVAEPCNWGTHQHLEEAVLAQACVNAIAERLGSAPDA